MLYVVVLCVVVLCVVVFYADILCVPGDGCS